MSAREPFTPSSLQTLSDNSGGRTGLVSRPVWVSIIVYLPRSAKYSEKIITVYYFMWFSSFKGLELKLRGIQQIVLIFSLKTQT